MHIIADFSWGACGDCKHGGDEGGCRVNTDQWEAALIIEHDFILCGSWASSEPAEPVAQDQGPALPGFEG